ncbi:MAG: ATP-binding cassette domain-containing protein [Anaerolineales bacterium]|nr:ATP-binding cassette domain-containing protein [Anaerolineales bacterium]
MVSGSNTLQEGLKLENIHKSFGDTRALRGVSFNVHVSEIVAILGPSGCGKSTLLEIIAGLDQPDEGAVFWNGNDINHIPPHKRNFGLMFQDYVLFPHMNVFDNVAFGLRMRRLPDESVEEQVSQILDLVGLQGFADRDVNTLSGGEQQRVALARSLVPEPILLMLDEPLGSLDRALRERLLIDLSQILRNIEQTTIYVTHDQEEAFSLADRVVVMEEGKVAQIGTPESIYRKPASLFVARFLGFTNLLPARGEVLEGLSYVETALGRWPWRERIEGEVTVLLRPDSVHLNGAGPCKFTGEIVGRSFRGSVCRTEIITSGFNLNFDLPSTTPIPALGSAVEVSFEPEEALQVFP